LFDFDRGGVHGGVYTPENFIGTSNAGFGGWLFADATFAELSVAFMGGPSSLVWRDGGISGTNRLGDFFAINIGLLGKFPFAFRGGNVFVFPLLGAGYNIVVFERGVCGTDTFQYLDANAAEELSSFRIKTGIGGDFAIRGNLFIRASVLGFFRFGSRWERELAGSIDGSARGFGGTAKVGVGFRF